MLSASSNNHKIISIKSERDEKGNLFSDIISNTLFVSDSDFDQTVNFIIEKFKEINETMKKEDLESYISLSPSCFIFRVKLTEEFPYSQEWGGRNIGFTIQEVIDTLTQIKREGKNAYPIVFNDTEDICLMLNSLCPNLYRIDN